MIGFRASKWSQMHQHGAQRTPKENQQRPKWSQGVQNGTKMKPKALKVYQKAIQQIKKKRCSKKVDTGTSTLIRVNRLASPLFHIYKIRKANLGAENRCPNSSKKNARTGIEKEQENNQ